MNLRDVLLAEYQETTGLGENEWNKTPSAASSMEKLRSQELELKLIRKQKDRLNTNDPSNENRKWRDLLIKLFTTSRMGLGISTSVAGKRSKDDQRAFARALHDLSNCKHPDPLLGANSLWCPVTGLYWPPDSMRSADIYPYASGAAMMQELFRTEESELFSPLNAIYMSKPAERYMDKGYYVIVPDVEDQSSLEQVTRWANQTPREYKIRIIAREKDELKNKIQAGSSLRWLDLDNKRLQFRSAHRPRARYLNYMYLITMLRRSWDPKLVHPADVLKDDLGKPWWGTITRRMRSSELLQAIIEEGSHDYYALERGSDEGAEGGDAEEGKGKEKAKTTSERLEDMQKDLIMGTANAHIASSLRREETYDPLMPEDEETDDDDEDTEE